jgi:hypothetical protein
MEQTKSYVKLYIIPADEYQSNTSLNHPVSVPPLILIPRFRLRPSFPKYGGRDGATGSAFAKPSSPAGLVPGSCRSQQREGSRPRDPSFAEPQTLADRGMKMRLEVANVFAARGDARPPTSGGGLLPS